MHWTAEQILWAVLLAAHLVLLIVLLGRDRNRRFPWFTASIVLSTVRLIADHLLNGKLTNLAFYWQSGVTLLLGDILAIVVLVELARQVFSSGKAGLLLNAKGWLGWSLVTVGVAGLGAWLWSPWPTWQEIQTQAAGLPLTLLGIAGTRGVIFTGLLTVEVGLLLILFGQRFGSGWKSHPIRIAIGLSSNALGYVAIDRIQNLIINAFKASMRTEGHHVTQAEYDHTVQLLTRLGNVALTLWCIVLLWWIFCLWRDDPSSPSGVSAEGAPVLAGPMPSLEAEAPEDYETGGATSNG